MLRARLAAPSLVSLLLAAPAAPQDLLVCDFTGTAPAANTPWTQTSHLDPDLAFSGWTLGAGATPDAGVDDALGFWVSAGASPAALADALADGEFAGFTLAPLAGTLDLGGKQVRLTVQRLSWWAPTRYALFSSVAGFAPGAELFATAPVGLGDFSPVEHTFVVPLAGYDGLTGGVEFRLYGFGGQYGGHATSLTDFRLVDPGPVHAFSLSATPGGSASSTPPGGLLVDGTAVTLAATPEPGHHFTGWSGDVVGGGNPRTVVVQADTAVTAEFAPNGHSGMLLGSNLPGAVDWTTAWIFVDQMRLAREWLTRSVGGSEWESGVAAEIPADADGWPTHLPFLAGDGNQHYVHTLVPAFVAGDHTVFVEGTGTLRVRGAAESGFVTVAGGTSFVLGVAPGNEGAFLLELHDSDPADPLRDLRVVMPGFEGDYAAQPFHPLFLSRLAAFENVRFMDAGHTNDSPLVSWAERTTPARYTQTGPRGIALELMAELANVLGAEPWICIPHLADDDYVRECARLLRDQVDPELTIHVEYSNETWNSIFSQTGWVQSQGAALGLDPNPLAAGQKYAALRSLEIWEIFAEEIPDSSRLCRVLATQSASVSVTNTRFAALADPVLNPAFTMPDALAIAPYFGHIYSPDDLPPLAPAYPAVDELFDVEIPALFDTVRQHVRAQKAVADEKGARLTCYEAGQHFVGIFGAENDDVLTQILQDANRDPRMFSAYVEYLDLLDGEGVELCDHFTYAGGWSKWGSWGALEYQDQPLAEAPKHRALEEWAPLRLSADPPELTLGTAAAVDLALSGGPAHAQRPYFLLAGLSGSVPGEPLPSGQILPLNADGLTDLVIASYGGPSLPGFSGFLGTLDPAGGAVAQLVTFGPLPPELAGLELTLAFGLSDPWGGASNPEGVLLVP